MNSPVSVAPAINSANETSVFTTGVVILVSAMKPTIFGIESMRFVLNTVVFMMVTEVIGIQS